MSTRQKAVVRQRSKCCPLTASGYTLAAVLALFLGTAVACRPASPAPDPASSEAPAAAFLPGRGGELVVNVRAEPQSFTWFTRRDGTTQLLTLLTQARLARVNRATEELEPWLAESWTGSPDGLRYILKLRPNVTFADGHPFSADDVVFSFAAAYARGSALADSLLVNGARLGVQALDPGSVEIAFPSPFGPGLRLLDNLPILPKHKLQTVLDAGDFADAWNLSTPLSEITGLGPFVLDAYVPGQRVVLTRNDRYFRTDQAGVALPYLDRITVEIVPEQDAQILRLDSGQSDMPAFEVRPEDYTPLKRAAEAGRVQLLDLGPGLDTDGFWINLKAGAFTGDPRAAWIQRDELRQAISLAIDRKAFADTVFLGAATPVFGPVTPANKKWYSTEVPHAEHNVDRARVLLATIGLTAREEDGRTAGSNAPPGDRLLRDERGAPARFTLLTQKGQTALERGAAVIRDQLKTLGLTVDVVMLDGNALVQRFLSGRGYDAIYFRFGASDTDPAISPDFWLSSGSSHVWNLGQKTPASDWERRIDAAMARQMTSLDDKERHVAFVEAQTIFAAHAPVVYFAAPRIYVAAAARVRNLSPAVLRPQLLWSADSIAVVAR
jgi:peptide/nickel transport system substrate-binding protein